MLGRVVDDERRFVDESLSVGVFGKDEGMLEGLQPERVLLLVEIVAKRGHTVTLYEKSDRLGGVFIAAAAPSFKEKDRDLITWYRREIQKF